ncbi:MAG: putative FAD-linked sulfhydryl oxidase [Harvfovirus sp.]|uniref:Sulfhydryl oxidase n=1 Tax=Harvfovirus sp. TaxID=2487768 RepID=A0A3G5A729_9VIRU|nr:MAG: putative FAD-linked sulfhydryl oxidase [Harvfovirus sp.]
MYLSEENIFSFIIIDTKIYMIDDPTIWGPAMWRDIHKRTLNYPRNPTSEDKREMYEFFMNLPDELRCDLCANNLRHHLRTYQLTYHILSSRKRLCFWCVDLHNLVNQSLGKRELSYEEALQIHLAN